MITLILMLLKKDFIIYLKDKRAVLLSIVLPAITTGFFGYVFGSNAGTQDPTLEIAAVIEDSHALSQSLLQALQEDNTLHVTILSRTEAENQIQNNKIPSAIIIPAGFGEQVSSSFFTDNSNKEILFLYDPSHRIELGMLKGIFIQHAMRVISQNVFSLDTMSKLTEKIKLDIINDEINPNEKKPLLDLLNSAIRYIDNINKKEAHANAANQAEFKMPFNLKEQAITAQKENNYNYFAHAFAGMSVQFILFLSVELAVLWLMEQERGLFKRFRLASISPRILLCIRLISSACINFIALFVVLFLCIILYKIHIAGSMLGLIVTLFATGLMSASLGLFIAAIGKTPQATKNLSTFSILLLVMLSGAWIPSFLFPSWLKTITLALPSRWAIDGIESMLWRGLDWSYACKTTGVLVLFSLLFFGISLHKFKHSSLFTT